MLVKWRRRGTRLSYRFIPEAGDRGTDRHGARLVRTRCSLELPDGWDLDRTHPDVLALSGMILVHPWIGRRVRFQSGISSRFATATGLDAGPIDPSLEGRRVPADGTPALAFSGGVDSTAALLVLPQNTNAVYLERQIPTDLGPGELVGRAAGLRRRRHRTDAALAAVDAIAAAGHRTAIVRTDLEFVRYRVGFPVDIATAIPILVTADRYRADAVAFGTVMESAYRTGHARFSDYAAGTHFRLWGGMFSAVGLPFHQVTAGLSEVTTLQLVNSSAFAGVAQSCVRGGAGTPCGDCVKCFRKALVGTAVEGVEPTDDELDRLFAISEARAALHKTPIHHENVYAFATHVYRGSHPLMTALRQRVRGDTLDVTWMRRWYPPAAALLPEHRREQAVAAIAAAVPPMTSDDIAAAEGWDAGAALATEPMQERVRQLAEALSAAA